MNLQLRLVTSIELTHTTMERLRRILEIANNFRELRSPQIVVIVNVTKDALLFWPEAIPGISEKVTSENVGPVVILFTQLVWCEKDKPQLRGAIANGETRK